MSKRFLTLAAATALIAAPALAQDFKSQVKARQGQFQIIALSLAELGAIAKGEKEYSAETAQAAADTLAGIAMVDPSLLWVEGSDNVALDTTRANPSIWDDNADFLAKWGAFQEGAMAMQAAAGEGQQAIGATLGQVGGTCKACHQAHRGPAL